MELQRVIEEPIQRTSTPAFGSSTNANDENPYYSNFCTKLEAPLTKATIRGVYGPKQDLINGHLVMKHSKTNVYDRNCTYIMRFSREFSTCLIEESYHCQPHVQYYYPYSLMSNVYHYQHQQQPIAQVMHQLTPMHYLPVKYR